MIDPHRPHLLHFNGDYVKEVYGDIEFKETDPKGLGIAKFTVSEPALQLISPSNQPIITSLKVQKCADGAFVTFLNGNAHLHLVELKSTIKEKQWIDVIQQFIGMFLTSLASARLLNISDFSSTTCYILGTVDKITDRGSLSLGKVPVGSTKTIGGREYWEGGYVDLPYGNRAPLVKGWRQNILGSEYDFGVV